MMIIRRTRLSRNTVKKWLRMPDGNKPGYQRCSILTKLTPYEDQLKQALNSDSYPFEVDKHTALRLLEELQKAGYDGDYMQLTDYDYIRVWRKAGVGDAGKQAFLPLIFCWGEAFQFDWSKGR